MRGSTLVLSNPSRPDSPLIATPAELSYMRLSETGLQYSEFYFISSINS